MTLHLTDPLNGFNAIVYKTVLTAPVAKATCPVVSTAAPVAVTCPHACSYRVGRSRLTTNAYLYNFS